MQIPKPKYYEGNINLLDEKQLKLGIVGSRSILSQTKDFLENLFLELQNFNICVVSGGMYGVDIYAHNLALSHGMSTIFVLPQGIDSYKNSYLYAQIKFKKESNFLITSEYEAGFEPRKYTYIERNKIISKYSNSLLVAQASLNSGSLTTANFAIKDSKKVICVPFSLDIRQFQGTNYLIDRGCKIYLNPTTVLDSLNILTIDVSTKLIELLKKSSRSFIELEKLIDINPELIKKNLLKLILEGQIFFDGEKYSI